MGKPKKNEDYDVETAVEETLTQIDEHELSGSDVPQSVTVEFLSGIISGLRTRTGAIKEEMDEDDEDDEF